MASELTLRLITPDRIVLDTRVQYVSVPGVDGSIGILPRHAPMVAALDMGRLRYRENDQDYELFVSGWFVEVRGNTVRIVSEAGERHEDIDEERALAAKRRAQERLTEAASLEAGEIDILRAQLALRRAEMRLRVKNRYAHTLV